VIKSVAKNCYKDEKTGKPLIYPGENHQDTIESPTVALVCDTPTAEPMAIPVEKWKVGKVLVRRDFLEQYAHDLIHGNEADHEYSYNERLRHWCHTDCSSNHIHNVPHELDQIQYIINKLKTSSASRVTRRAIATTWYPGRDWVKEDVPCLQLVHFIIRNRKLQMEIVFRSEDMLYGAGANMFGLVRLGQWVAEQIGIPFGTYTHIAQCPHLYFLRDEDDISVFAPELYQ
jgi:thymidylate synthase